MKIILQNKKEFFQLLEASRLIHDSECGNELNENAVLNNLAHAYLVYEDSEQDLKWVEDNWISIRGCSLVEAVKEFNERGKS